VGTLPLGHLSLCNCIRKFLIKTNIYNNIHKEYVIVYIIYGYGYTCTCTYCMYVYTVYNIINIICKFIIYPVVSVSIIEMSLPSKTSLKLIIYRFIVHLLSVRL
jgi:hypothetical protein